MNSISSFRSFLPVYKPKGWTSNDVVRKVKGVIKRETPFEIRVGHGGTLDPIAEGVLVLGLGAGTKYLDKFLSGRKVYRAKALFGTSTDTLDATGTINGVMHHQFVTIELVDQAIRSFIGNIRQTPPMYSSLKINGVRLYNYARKGITVDRPAREVTVNQISILDSSPPDWFQFEIDCDGGFYVRSFIDDLANAMGTKAHMSELVRLRHGDFSISDCMHSVEDLNMNSIVTHQINIP
jgi:tRNA pseudouridine55 synthase